jgi:hydroxymethylbilane synthase
MTVSMRIGSRGSALALAQAHFVKGRLEALSPAVAVEIKIIKTTGDRMADASLASLGGKGVFTKEIEDALFSNQVDLAVHSLKDLPTKLPEGLSLAAVLEREDPRDCLVSRFGENLLELPRHALVGTSSPRRRAQLRAVRKGLKIEDLRGNLDTRIRRVVSGDFAAVVVALAGLRRLGRDAEVTEILPFDAMLPAPAQGCIGVEIRADDAATRAWVSRLNHAPSERAATAERSFLSGLGGGCRAPIAAYAREEGGWLLLDGLVISPDGARACRGRHEGKPEKAEAVGRELAERLLAQGALEILETLPPPA